MCYECEMRDLKSLKQIFQLLPIASIFLSLPHYYWTQTRARRHRTGCKGTSPFSRLSLCFWLKLSVFDSFPEDTFCLKKLLIHSSKQASGALPHQFLRHTQVCLNPKPQLRLKGEQQAQHLSVPISSKALWPLSRNRIKMVKT